VGWRTAEEQFGALREAFARARRARPDAYSETFYEFAGRPVRFGVVGRALGERVTVPFAHLRFAPPRPLRAALTVELWDASGAATPAPTGSTETVGGRTWTVDGGLVSSSPGDRFVSYWREHSLMWLDRDSGSIVGCVEAADGLTLHERSKPLPMLLPLWYRDRGVQIVHAGLVARQGRGALVAGPTGAGKSTLTLACLCAGLESLGDDHVGLEAVDGAFVGHSLYGTTRLGTPQLRLFPELLPGAVRDHREPGEKELIVLARVLPGRLRSSVTADVLVLPRLGDGAGPPTERASRGEALRRVAPSSLVMAMGSGQRGLDTLAGLVRRVPAYWLDPGREPREMARRMERLLAGTT
jgi:hypothetical protein